MGAGGGGEQAGSGPVEQVVSFEVQSGVAKGVVMEWFMVGR